MIPRTIQIKNFLSYGTNCPPISFESHNLICLSGNNGHGKSALLDAITWAIWGCARKIQNSSRADQGLLRLGQTDMMVIFDCTIQGITYRIKREFELIYGKPKTTLDFGILTDDETINPLTEKTIRDTQTCINKIIGLDYETFINSSFLRQGNANEFSKRSPKERKEIISTILGLDMYDALKRVALEKGKIASQEVATMNTLLAHTRAEKEMLSTLLAGYAAFNDELTTITNQITVCTDTQKKLTENLAQQESIKQQLLVQKHDQTTQQAVYTQLLQELKTLVTIWRTTRARSADTARYTILQQQILIVKKEYVQAQATLATYHTTKDQLQTIEHEHTQISHAITTLTTQIKTEQRLILERLTHTLQQVEDHKTMLEAQEKSVSDEIVILQNKTIDTTRTIDELTQKTAHSAEVQKLFDKKKETYHHWTTLGNVLRDEQHAQLQRLALTQDVQNPSCPLCEQSLSAARKRFLQTKIEGRVYIQAHQLERFKRILPKLKQQLIAEHTALQLHAEQKTALHTLEHARQQDTAKIIVCSKSLSDIQEKKQSVMHKAQELTAQKKTLVTITAQEPSTPELTTLRIRAAEINDTITKTKAAIAALSYNPNTIETLNRQLQELQKGLDLYENLAQATFIQQERATAIATLVTKLKKEKVALKKHAYLDSHIAQCMQTITTLFNEKQTTLTQEHTLRSTHQMLLVEQGKYDAARTAYASAKKSIDDLEQRTTKAESVVQDYQAIAAAVGKDGIQALLIEEAIPEIEEYANTLLAKLTNNTAHIMIESLRDLKNGGTKETLDIKISDTQGVRPYEMFSGGEAFRIDIALRIAISKLLAHRAGTALQTLIIDEGFGSQDEDGLNAMIDVLHTLQTEFEKIIVVSHLPMMKDQFPVHFVVEKGSHGSMIRIIEQG